MKSRILLALALSCAHVPPRAMPEAFEAQRLSLQIWEPSGEPIAPHQPAELYEVTCEKEPDRQPSCSNGGSPSAEGKPFEDRLAACFQVRRAQASAELLQQWAGALAQPRLPPPFEPVPGGFAEVHVRVRQRVPETRGAGCEHGPGRDPRTGAMIGCDPVVVPTGRTVVSEWSQAVQVFPAGWKERPIFFPRPAEVYWIHLGSVVDQRFTLDPPFAALGPGIPAPDRALEVLARYPEAGPADLRAALLIDTAIAQFRLGDLAAGRETTRRLRALVDAEHPDERRLAARISLQTMEQISAGRWLLSDPCEKQ